MYCTQQDLVERFGIEELEVHAWDDTTEAIDDSKVDQACQDATDEINLYVASHIALPATTTPPVLVRIACDIARYNLQARNPLDEAKARYEAAIRTLKDIAAGRASLGEAGQATGPGNVEALRDDSDRVFTLETLADF